MISTIADTAFNLKSSVESRKAVLALGAPDKTEKDLITNQVTTIFIVSPVTPMSYTSFSRSTEVFKFNTGRILMKTIIALMLLVWSAFPFNVSAGWLSVEMEGAKEVIHLDTTNGALYVGSDCTPMLYFSKDLRHRSKLFKHSGKRYSVQKSRSRSLKKSAMPSRLPTTIVVDGDSVIVLSDSIVGQAQAKGKVKASVIAGRKSAKRCK